MKYLALMILCVCSFLCNAQRIIYDNTQSDGTRTILCTYIELNPEDNVQYSIGVGATVVSGITTYAFTIETKTHSIVSINRGMKLLLKDGNGNVMTLEALTDGSSSYDNGMYEIPSFYRITEKQLQTLSTNGVIKIRQEYSSGVFDKEFNGDEISWVINEEYPLIKEALKTKKSIYSDF